MVGGWADGLITIGQPLEDLERVITAFRDAGGGDKPVSVQVQLSWHEDEATALELAVDQWRNNVLPPDLLWNLELTEQFDAAGAHVRAEDVRGPVLISTDPAWHAERLAEMAEVGADALYLHHVGKEQEAFVDTFAAEVLPRFDDRRSEAT
jgi:alkanesulfonate monooxygenase SsuD/methylene tetrahydromethanopterin reductase-like flavin-dependent oxidoreductase (luciferase family)